MSSKLLTEEQKAQCLTMATLSSANTKYTAEQIAKATGISAETLATWGLTEATDTLTISQLAEMSSSDLQAKKVLEKIIAQNAQSVANGEVTASNITLAASETSATLATGSFTTAIKANIAAMWTWMTTTPLGWLTLLVGAIFATVKAYDALTVSIEEQKEKMEESLSAYQDAKTELSNITTELESQEQAMNDLLEKDKLTYAEKGQLEELQAITQELRIQKDLAEKEEGRTKKEVATDASDLFKKQFGKYNISENAINEYQNNADITGNNAILIFDENDISAMIAGYKQFNELLEEAYGEGNQDNVDHFKSLIDDLSDSIFSTAQDLQKQQDSISDYYNTIKDISYEDLTTDQKEIIDSYNEISNAISLIYRQLDPNTWNSMQIDNLFATEGVEKTKEELIEMAKAGTLDENTIKSYSKLNSTLEDSNMVLVSGQSAANALCGELYALADAEKDIQGSNPTNEIDLLSISSTIDQLNTKLKPAMDSLESAWNNIFTDDGFTLENIDLSTFESIKSKLDEMAELGLEVDTSSFENFVTVLNDTDSTAEQVKDAFDDLATSIVDAGVSGIEDFQLLKDTLQEMGVQNFEMVAFEELVKNTEALNEALKNAGITMDDLVVKTEDGSIVASDAAKAFAEEMVGVENAARAYNLLLYAKELNNLAKMSTAGEVAELQNLTERAGVTGEIIQWLTRLQLVYQQVANRTLDPQTIQDYVFEAKELTAKIQNAATEVKFSGNEVDYKPLTKATGKAGKDAGEEYKKKLQDELSNLGDVLNYINGILQDQIDLLGDQKDAAVDALEAEREASIAALEAEKERIQAQIDAKQKEIDKIKEAREQRQAEIDLQKKQYELAKMQNQRTSLIYKEGNDGVPGQMVYQHDLQGIRDAKEAADEAKENLKILKLEREISNLEDIIESIDKQIDATNEHFDDLIKQTEAYYDSLIKGLEDYQKRWKELEDIENQAKIQVKLKELGITTEDILNMSEDAFNSFKQQYLAILTEMYSGEQDMIQAINDVANGIDVTTLTEGLNQTKENIDNLNEADFNSVSMGLNDISDGMGNVGTSASSASESTSSVSSDLQEMNTNAEGLDTKLSNISSALNDIPTSDKFDELATSFTNLGTAIQSVADALGISGEDSVSGLVTALTELGSFSLSGEKGEGGIIEQFQNLKTAVDDVTSAINGGGSTGESASATNASGARTGSSMGTGNSTAGGGSGLTGAIKEIGTTTDETIGSGGEGEGTGGKESEGEGVLGKFGQFKSAVEEVTKAIGTGEEESGEEGATSLISALQLHYEKAGETLPEVKNMFEELLAKILECVSALGELAGAMSSLGGKGFAFGTVGTGFASGTDPKASFTTTVGKAFAKGTDRFKGLDKDTLALRSEYNQSELTMYPDGKIELTNSPNLKVLPKNTKIFNEKQTQEMLNNKGTVVGNAYADGSAVLEKPSRFDNMRDLQPGDRMYDMFQKWNAYFEKNDHSFIEPVNAIQKNTEEIARSVSNVNTNNIQRSVNIGDINITCPGVTSNEVAAQVSTELHKQIGGIALEVLQESHITR